MLIEYLQTKYPEYVQWLHDIPGAHVCQFTLSGSTPEDLSMLPAHPPGQIYEIFFCLGGQVVAKRPNAKSHTIEKYDVLVLSSVCAPDSVKISGNLQGILITIEPNLSHDGLFSVFTSLGLPIDLCQLTSKLAVHYGYTTLCNRCWGQAIFDFLAHLPKEACGRYCLLKAMELLYILTVKDHSSAYSTANQVPKNLLDARAYMESHLSEKITIADLSRLLAVSPTYLKAEFRRIYGTSIHGYLTDLRMRRAAELIHCTDLPIYQIAQQVGYAGMNQFSSVFKRYYGVTPGQFKKMSKAGMHCLFQ